MTIIGKILKVIAMILLVAVLLHLFMLTLRLDTDDQKLRTDEITIEEAMDETEIANKLVRILLTFILSLMFAGISFIIDTSRKISDDIDDLPEQIPANDKEEDERKRK